MARNGDFPWRALGPRENASRNAASMAEIYILKSGRSRRFNYEDWQRDATRRGEYDADGHRFG